MRRLVGDLEAGSPQGSIGGDRKVELRLVDLRGRTGRSRDDCEAG